VWQKLMLGLSTRKYGEAVREFREAYGLEKSAISEHFIEASQAKLKQIMERMDLNPSAARSLGEGMDEPLTVHRLGIPSQLRKTLACTNVIESAFAIVERVCRNVKRWHDGDQRERWVGSGLLVAEKQFRRFQGYKPAFPTFLVHPIDWGLFRRMAVQASVRWEGASFAAWP
jgi:hypothetical protein